MTVTTSAARTVRSQDGTAIAYQTIGEGEGVLVLGGAWRAAHDYLPLARELADSFRVHVIDRRGRGRSGPPGPDYSIDRELEDLAAVQAETEARIIFGHSYGGLIALEAARRTGVFTDLIAYEPGVSIGGSIPLGWMAPYRARLIAGDARGAFAEMMRGSGGAPPIVEHLPLWYLKLILRLVIKAPEWRRTEQLLGTALPEHEQVGAMDAPTAERFRTVSARALLLGGGKSRPRYTTNLFAQLADAIPATAIEILRGLDHLGPEKAPDVVASHIQAHLAAGRR